MKLFESQHYFQYKWEQVTAANWQKYPNPISTHVVAVDVLAREIDEDRQVLRTERLITCKQAIPKWLSVIVGGQEYSYVREVSEVDLPSRTLVMKSHNLTMSHLLSVMETVVYRPDGESRTVFEQQAEITAFGTWQRICNKIEEWSVERFGQNAIKGKAAFEGVLQVLSDKLGESEVFVNEVGTTILKEIDDVERKTQNVIEEVKKLGTSAFSLQK